MARILLVHPGPDFSVADVFNGWYKSLVKLGHEVMVYNTNDRLIFYGRALFENDGEPECGKHDCGCRAVHLALPDHESTTQMATKGLFDTCFLFWPDVVFFVSAFFQKAATFEVLRKRDMKIVMLHTESPYQDDEQMMRGQFADLNLLNDPSNIEAWRDLEVPALYQPHAYDPDVHYPDRTGMEKDSDFTFVGTAFASRQRFFHEMDFTGLRVTLGGNGWDQMLLPEYSELVQFLGHDASLCVPNEEAARVYRISKTGINFYRREGEDTHEGEGWAMGPREVEMAACGLYFVRDPRGESDEVFDGILPTFANPGEASDLIKWAVKHDAERERAANKAMNAIIDRTFDAHARKLCVTLEELGIL